MDFNEYAEKFCNIKIADDTDYEKLKEVEKSLNIKLSGIMLEKYKNGQLTISNDLSGHKFNSSVERLNSKNITQEDLLKILEKISRSVAKVLQEQSEKIDRITELLSGMGKDVSKFVKIDINDVFKGNLQWIPGTIYNPEMKGFQCHNDGNQYILTMNNWEINLINMMDFIMEKKVKGIEPFGFNNSPVETQIEFKTNELVVFNNLPEKISNFIESQFSKETFEYSGRDWQKNLNEIYKCFKIYRTPAYCGGTVFQDDNYVILGRFDDENGNPPEIGKVSCDVWQTLIAEKEDIIKLIMLSLDKNKSDSEDFFKTEFIEENNAFLMNVELGKYYSYNVPTMNNNANKNVYKDVKMQDVKSIDIDMLISKNKIKTTEKIDSIHVVPENEIEAAKKVFNDFEANTVSLKI